MWQSFQGQPVSAIPTMLPFDRPPSCAKTESRSALLTQAMTRSAAWVMADSPLWGERMYFSASDNSDPNLNAREYWIILKR
jgi:hypothetical protein